MNVTFEHTTVIYDNDIAEVLIGFGTIYLSPMTRTL